MINNKYFILLLVTLIFISGCGGDTSNYSGVIATATPPPVISSATATPLPTIMSEISGYVYTIPSTDPEGTNGVIITDVPVNTTDSAGNASLVSQVSTYLQQEEPTEWATSDCQEAYNQLTTALSGCQPATGSSVTTSYSDPNSSGLSVNAEGYFSGQLPVVANQSNVELEVATNEDEAYDVETITSSGLAASSTSGLECCPKRIIALPGDIALFEVCSSSENLKSSKLTFTLNNTSIGYVSPPVYLCVFGKNKYTKAYGFIYIKRNFTTPIDTTINAKTNTGLSLDIPVEVVKSTASISGKVFVGNKQLIKGYVKSIGPKAHCKLDSIGNYSLPKVFKGHDRKVVAVYWVMENGKKKKYKQVKVIDFFNADVTGFNFGEEATPTPTVTETPTVTPTYPPPSDKYYDDMSAKVMERKAQWQSELGWKQGRQKTVDWLNNLLPEDPLPDEIKNAVREAKIDEMDPRTMWIYYRSGVDIFIEDPLTEEDANSVPQIINIPTMPSTEYKKDKPFIVKNKKVLLLGPNAFEDKYNRRNLFENLPVLFKARKFECTSKGILDYNVESVFNLNDKPITIYDHSHNDTDHPQITFEGPATPLQDENDNTIYNRVIKCNVNDSNSVPFIWDFEHLDQYGTIFIKSHGNAYSLMACPFYENDPNTVDFVNKNKDKCLIGFAFFAPCMETIAGGGYPDPKISLYYKIVKLKQEYFMSKSYLNFEGSLLFICTCGGLCYSYNASFPNGYNGITINYSKETFKNAQVIIAPIMYDHIIINDKNAYRFFRCMLSFDPDDPNTDPNNIKWIPPMNVIDAYWKTLYQDVPPPWWHENWWPDFYYLEGVSPQGKLNTYLPANVNIEIKK